MPNPAFLNTVFLHEEGVIILFGGTNDSNGIGITPDGHIFHIPGNNPEGFREVSALVLAAASLAEQAQHMSNAHMSQRMGEIASELFRSAAGSLKPLLADEESNSSPPTQPLFISLKRA